MKEKYDHRLLLKHLPSDLKHFLEHIQSLNYADKPDYTMLGSLFERCMRRRGVKETDPFDWEKNEQNESIVATRETESARNQNETGVSTRNQNENASMKNGRMKNITEATNPPNAMSGMEYVSRYQKMIVCVQKAYWIKLNERICILI
jgi:tau tubulin kinase